VAAYTIDFCFGPPDDPVYPEGVVVALLRGHSPKGKDNNPSPTGETYLTPGASASLPPELARLREATPAKQRILSVTNEGTLAPYPDNGSQCTSEQVTNTTEVWWCGRERATVITEIVLEDDQRRVVTWSLLSIANERVNADVHWRIGSAE
jgi:hypothetical protein